MSTNYDTPSHAHMTPIGRLDEDRLLDSFDVVRKVTLAAGQGALERGTALGKITATKKWVVSTTGATDGSQTIRGVILQDTDATLEVEQIAGIRGMCNGAALILGTGHALPALRQGVGISSLIDLQSVVG